MTPLLDTHALLWWMADDDRLGLRARDLIAAPANDILVSVVSLWEIVVQVRAGQLTADVGEILVACDNSGFNLLGITQPHLRTLSTLPMHHRDPFDHLLMAQAIVEEAAFVSADRHARLYQLSTIDCTDAF